MVTGPRLTGMLSFTPDFMGMPSMPTKEEALLELMTDMETPCGWSISLLYSTMDCVPARASAAPGSHMRPSMGFPLTLW